MSILSFSKDGDAALRHEFGSDADTIIPALEEVIAGFPSCVRILERDDRQEWETRIRRLRECAAALQSARDALNGSGEDANPETDRRLCEDLLRRECEATDRIAQFERILEHPCYRGRQGRPRDERRRCLSNGVGSVLVQHRIKLGKTRGGGRFHVALSRVIEVVENELPPENLYPLLEETRTLFDRHGSALAKLPVVAIALARLPRLDAPETWTDSFGQTSTIAVYFARPLFGVVRREVDTP